jgi:hypothetical protein
MVEAGNMPPSGLQSTPESSPRMQMVAVSWRLEMLLLQGCLCRGDGMDDDRRTPTLELRGFGGRSMFSASTRASRDGDGDRLVGLVLDMKTANKLKSERCIVKTIFCPALAEQSWKRGRTSPLCSGFPHSAIDFPC